MRTRENLTFLGYRKRVGSIVAEVLFYGDAVPRFWNKASFMERQENAIKYDLPHEMTDSILANWPKEEGGILP